jgi:hypothetical protein
VPLTTWRLRDLRLETMDMFVRPGCELRRRFYADSRFSLSHFYTVCTDSLIKPTAQSYGDGRHERSFLQELP